MAVFDQPDHVRRTIDSVLVQRGVEFELIIIDDGATATVKQVLKEYMAEQRVRVVEQSNHGLTAALINGCKQSQHPLVARIDAGDIMLPTRLSMQANLLALQESVGLVASWVDMVTEEGYSLYRNCLSTAEILAGARALDADQVRTPFHASVMFRKSIYERAGGYRPEFYFAQDCELWSRMAVITKFHVIDKVLTIGLFSPAGISGQFGEYQRHLTSLVAKANGARLHGMADEPIYKAAQVLRPQFPRVAADDSGANRSDFAALYFLARCLSDNHSPHASEYWRKTIRVKPYSVISWLFLVRSLFYRGG